MITIIISSSIGEFKRFHESRQVSFVFVREGRNWKWTKKSLVTEILAMENLFFCKRKEIKKDYMTYLSRIKQRENDHCSQC